MILPEIGSDQTIYRFLNFFDLFNLVKDKQIRFTKLHKLDDKNEGLGKILRSLELSPVFPTNLESLKNTEYPITKHSTYVSCWTTVPDNIAMWTIYSPNKSGIRIKTTVSKLYAAINNYKKDYSKIEDFQPNQIDVFKMVYEDLKKLKNDIESKVKMTSADMREATGKSTADALRAKSKPMRKHLQDPILDNDSLKYKDENYFHEEEDHCKLIKRISDARSLSVSSPPSPADKENGEEGKESEKPDWPTIYFKIIELSQSIIKREWEVVKKGK